MYIRFMSYSAAAAALDFGDQAQRLQFFVDFGRSLAAGVIYAQGFLGIDVFPGQVALGFHISGNFGISLGEPVGVENQGFFVNFIWGQVRGNGQFDKAQHGRSVITIGEVSAVAAAGAVNIFGDLGNQGFLLGV